MDIDGFQIEIHGMRAKPFGTQIELPQFRGANGLSLAAITLPEEVRGRCVMLFSMLSLNGVREASYRRRMTSAQSRQRRENCPS